VTLAFSGNAARDPLINRVGCGGAAAGDAGPCDRAAAEHGPSGLRAVSWFRSVARPGDDRAADGYARRRSRRLEFPIEPNSAATRSVISHDSV
jgi:hypothetical protein